MKFDQFQHVGPNNVASCWPTMLQVFARALSERNVRMTSTSYVKWYYDRIHRKLGKIRAVFLIL